VFLASVLDKRKRTSKLTGNNWNKFRTFSGFIANLSVELGGENFAFEKGRALGVFVKGKQ
jgi:hypothetical protein